MPTPMTPGASERSPDTIVLVHGFWVTPRSWEHWIAHYGAKGYRRSPIQYVVRSTASLREAAPRSVIT